MLRNDRRMRPTPIPPELGERFTVGQARDRGVSPKRLRASDLQRPFHGVRARPRSDSPSRFAMDRFCVPRGPAEVAHLERALDFATHMSEAEFFSGVTAALFYEVPLPRGLADGDLDISVFAPGRLPRAAGIRGHEAARATTHIRLHVASGLRMTSPASTWATLGAVLRHPHDLVAAGDALVRDWRVDEPLCTVGELEAAVAAGRRVGVRKLREALPHVRTRSASRPETRCRLALTDAGLPEPELNFDVVAFGTLLACVDLAYPALRIAIEYEGEHHLLNTEQWARDIERYDRLREAGWIVIRVTKAELFGSPGLLVARVRRAIASRG